MAQALCSKPEWTATTWDDAERAAWTPPEILNTVEWAAKYRYLSRRQSPARPGWWRDENQPLLRGIMWLCCQPMIREIWIKKASQFGVSEAIRNEIGRRAHLDPQPILLCLPDERKGREIIRKRIIPLFEDTECLRNLLTGRRLDFKLNAISLINGTDLQLAWSGSPSSLASDPIACAILDEVDKFQQMPGRESNPVDLARVRLKTLEKQDRSILIALSSPTTDDGPIAMGFEQCPSFARLSYYIRCPHCGTFQTLIHDRLCWEPFRELGSAADRAEAIDTHDAAWFACENIRCAQEHPEGRGRILEEHKLPAMLAGYWGTADGSWKLFFQGNRQEGTFPASRRIALHCPDYYNAFRSIASCAAEFVRAEGRPDLAQAYYNQTAADTFKLNVGGPAISSAYEKLCRPDPASGFVPPPEKKLQPWVSRLVMTVDTQKDHFYWVVRGYGPHGSSFRSHRVDHGRVVSFADLEEIFYRAHYPYVGDEFKPLRAHKLGIDARGGTEDEELPANRTEQVYRWCLIDPEFRIPLVGTKPFEARIRWRIRDYKPGSDDRSGFTVRYYLWDGTFFRDLLGSYIAGRLPIIDDKTGEIVGETPQWLLNDRNDAEYNRHMANVVKQRKRSGRGYVVAYTTKITGARHDFHDCEAMQVVMAHHLCGCLTLPTPQMIADMHKPRIATGGGIRRPDGRAWISKR